jgi:hypothetical protein
MDIAHTIIVLSFTIILIVMFVIAISQANSKSNLYTQLRKLLFLISAWSLVFSLFSFYIASIAPRYYPPFTILFSLNFFSVFVLTAIYLRLKKHKTLILASGILLIISLFFYSSALYLLPSAEVFGFFWIYLVGLGDIFSVGLGISLLVLYSMNFKTEISKNE